MTFTSFSLAAMTPHLRNDSLAGTDLHVFDPRSTANGRVEVVTAYRSWLSILLEGERGRRHGSA